MNESIKDILARIKTDCEFQGRVAERKARSEAKKRSERSRDARCAATRRYVKTHPIEVQARIAAKQAIADGRLKPSPCAERDDFCKGRIEMHHYLGYAPEHWLDVQFLCLRHHKMKLRRPSRYADISPY